LRTSDIRTITFEQLNDKVIKIKEQKTNKNRTIVVNQSILDALSKSTAKSKTGFVFKSQKNAVISTQQVNRLLKVAFSSLLPTHCISTHSLRKTFGRRVYENNNQSEKALMYLSELFNHSTMKLTRIYLGIKQEELDNIYMSL
jgi:integrase